MLGGGLCCRTIASFGPCGQLQASVDGSKLSGFQGAGSIVLNHRFTRLPRKRNLESHALRLSRHSGTSLTTEPFTATEPGAFGAFTTTTE